MNERFVTYRTWVENTVKTEEDNTETVATVAIPADTAFGLRLMVTGRRTDDGSNDSYYAIAAVLCNLIAGAANIVGFDVLTELKSDPSYVGVSFTTSGANLLIQVKGKNIAGTQDISWICRYTTNTVGEI